MPQTSVLAALPIGVEGMLADFWTEQNGVIDTAINVDTVSIPFGRAVKRTATGSVMLTAITDVIDGIVVHSNMYSKPDQLDSVGVVPSNELLLLRMGRIYVLTEQAFTTTSGVFVRALPNGGATTIGGFRTAADGTNTIDISAFAQFRNAGAAGDLAILEINLLGV